MATYQFDPSLKQLLLELTGNPYGEGATPEAAAQEVPVLARLENPAAEVPGLRVVSRAGAIVTGRVAVGNLVAVRGHRNVKSLKASRRIYPALARSVDEIRASAQALREGGAAGMTGRGVVIGMLDWGLDFAHDNFRKPDGTTRLLAVWDQHGEPGPSSPSPFNYGREHLPAAINRALRLSDPYGALGYDPLDADTRLPDGSYTGSHGTHTTDIAAGNGRASGSSPGVAPEADIVFVDLRGDDTDVQTQSLGDSVRLVEAAQYVVRKAGDRPVVLSMSVGSTGGPHDHTPLAVQALDALCRSRPGVAVVMSAGNYYNTRMHAAGRLAQGQRTDLRVILPGSRTRTAEVEIWYESGDEFGCEVIAPDGTVVAQVGPGQDRVVASGSTTVLSAFHRMQDPNNGDNQINVFLWPSAVGGEWRLRLTARQARDGRYHAYIERAGGQQARFAPGTDVTTYTTGTICNGRETIAVGAYDAAHPDKPLGVFSSSGPSRDGRAVPSVSAPGVAIVAAKSSSPVNGVRQRNRTTTMDGTSMAAPHVAGTVALMLQACGRQLPTAAALKQALASSARRTPPAGDAEARRYGAGRVSAAAAIAAIRRTLPARERDAVYAEQRVSLFAEQPSAEASLEAEALFVEAPESVLAEWALPHALQPAGADWADAPGDGAWTIPDATVETLRGAETAPEASGVLCLPPSRWSDWARLISFRPPHAVQRTLGRTRRMHRIEDGSGDVNLDHYPVLVTRMPSSGPSTPEALLEAVRRDLNRFLDTTIAEFSPYDATESAKWFSARPLTSVLHIDMKVWGGFNIDDGSVLCSEAAADHWIFSTIWTPADAGHPVSGNREFGFVRAPTGIVFYTRGADRLTSLMDRVAGDAPFNAAHALWSSFQSRLFAHVVAHGGMGAILPPTSCRYDWPAVRAAHHRPTVSWL
ncbi:MAG: S8 family serine peptidase [Gammaproteobacteria bacterium]